MLYSGVNIFGAFTTLYLQSKDRYQQQSSQVGGQSQSSTSIVASEGLSGASSNAQMQLGSEVLSLFKKMQKRDSITKIKAFHELKKYLDSVDAESEELPNILTFFFYHMCRILLNEHDKLVREATHDCFTTFIRKSKRKLGPHIKKIFPLWYCSFFDPSPEVVRLARSNFELAFPTDKQPEVFQLSYKMFLHFANEQLQSTDDASNVSGQDKKIAEEIYERVTCSVLQALANSFQFVKQWSKEDQLTYQKKLLEIFDLTIQQSQTQINTKQNQKASKTKSSYIWNFLATKYRGSIKSACLQFVAAFITEFPQDIVSYHIKDIAPAVLNLVSEQNPILQTTFWREALFTLTKNFQESWSFISIKKDFLPKLYKCLKDAAFGAPSSLYENFVKYLSVCPLYKLSDFAASEDKNNKASFKDRCNLIRELMITLYTSIQNDEAVQFHQELINSYCESLTFILLKRIQTIENPSDQEFAMKQMEKVIQIPLIDFINNYIKPQSKHQKSRTLRSSFVQRYVKVLVDLSERDFNIDLFKSVCETINNELNSQKRNSMRVISQIMEQSKLMKPQYKQIVFTQLVAACFNKQTLSLNTYIENLTKSNIVECTETAFCHRRLIYSIVKKQYSIDVQSLNLLKVGEVLTQVLKKEKLAKNVLSQDLVIKFKDLQLCLTDLAVLYIAKNIDIEEEFTKVLLAAGLLEVSSDDVKFVDPLEESLFRPQFPKVDLNSYYELLRSSAQIHDLMVGAVSVKMLAENLVVQYKDIVQKTINDTVYSTSTAILNEDDMDLLRTQVIQQLMTQNIPINSISAYFQCIQALCVQQDVLNDEFREILIENLISIRISSKEIEENYNKIWVVFQAAVQNNQDYQKYVTQKLKERVSYLISSSSDIQSFNHVTMVIRQFVQLMDNKLEIIAQILLTEQNFAQVQTNCLPIKMFKDLLLSGNVQLDVKELLSTTENSQYCYIWLASTFLAIKYLTSVSSLMELRRQLMIFVETEVIPAILSLASSSNHRQFIIQMFQYLCKTNQLHTFELLAKLMTDPGEQYHSDLKPVLKIDDFKIIFSENVAVCTSKLIESNFAEIVPNFEFLIITLQTIGYYIIDESLVQKIFKLTNQNLQQTDLAKLSQCRTQLEIYMSLEKWLSTADAQTQQFQVQLLNALLKLNSIEMKQIAISLCNTLLERQPVLTIKAQTNKDDLLYTIVELLESIGEIDCQHTINLCKVIRKSVNWSTQASDTIIPVLVQATMERALKFDNAIKNVNSKTAESIIQPFEIDMLQDLAETLLVCTQSLTEHALQQGIEDNLYYLLGCSFEALQKSAYVLLQHIYQNFLIPVEFIGSEETDLQNLMTRGTIEESKTPLKSTAFKNISKNLLIIIDEAPSIDHEDDEIKNELVSDKDQLESLVFGQSEEGQMNNKVFGYLLAWNAMLIKIEQGRIKAQLSTQQTAIQYLQVLSALTEYLETDSAIYHMMLISLVPYLPKLFKKSASTEQFSQELQTFQPEYCNPKDSRHARMICLMSLINFMKSFPSLGRKFFQECDRQISEAMLPYIKLVISPAILDNEIKKIEMSQLELGANSDLTFVLFKSTKEVIATYAKTAEIQCQLKLKIPHDYPLKSVQVDIGEQLKLKQTQIRKWTLSIRNLLQSRNGDIITAILLWKNNIDKEMQGIEECTICYSVMHQTDKSLPSMQCKNCKNKFHVACIRKWFNTSNKSNCPLCQTFFFQ